MGNVALRGCKLHSPFFMPYDRIVFCDNHLDYPPSNKIMRKPYFDTVTHTHYISYFKFMQL